jgi:hypothetical protein
MKSKLLIALLTGLLIGVFMGGILAPTMAEEQTLGYVVAFLNDTLNKLTSNELAILERRVTLKQINDATILMNQWAALLRISTEAGNIILER